MHFSNSQSIFVQAKLNLQEYEEAVSDFKLVLEVAPDNKAAKNQITLVSQKMQAVRDKEKKMYAGMFQKFAEIDAKVKW